MARRATIEVRIMEYAKLADPKVAVAVLTLALAEAKSHLPPESVHTKRTNGKAGRTGIKAGDTLRRDPVTGNAMVTAE
jgi:hypothetical protein